MKRTERSPLGFYTIGIAALFLAGFFLLVLFGAQTYRNTVSGQTGNNRTRSLLSYFSTCLRSNDAGGVEVRDTEYGPALVIPDGDTGYALRIYRADGALVEDFAANGAALRPQEAQVIGETDTFSVEALGSGVLAVTTDAGRVLLHVRSERSGEGQ